VASQLRLGVKQIDALESDRYDKLPQPSIVRGFIRNYAKLLRIDAAPILEAYSILVPNTTPQSFAVKSNTQGSVIGENRAHFSFHLFIGLIICFAVIVGFFYYYTQVIKPNVTTELSSSNTPTAELDALPNTISSEFALPPAERSAETITPIELPVPSADATDNLPTNNPTESNTQIIDVTQAQNSSVIATSSNSLVNPVNNTMAIPVKPSITPAPTELPTPTAQSVINAKSAKLVIDATEETWVSVTDANGKQIYSKVLLSGTTEIVTATPPLSITVGNAQGTSISMDGKPLDLLAHTRDKVARLKVN
jgi:cytoskeleton protein RodZ